MPLLQVLLYILAGWLIGEFVGYWHHRMIQHAMIRLIERAEKGRLRKIKRLFVPWKQAYYVHMWHHYTLYPEPTAPDTALKAFRPAHYYYFGKDLPENVHGILAPSDNDNRDWWLSRLGIASSIDWLVVAFLVMIPAFILLPLAAFAWFVVGMAIAAFLNDFVHASFHILPYDRWRDIPASAYLHPDIIIANLGAHLPLFKNYYAWLLNWHIAHHYHVTRVDQTNIKYRGHKLNAMVSNFTIYNPLPDFVFGTSCTKVYKEVTGKEKATA